jgi:hypothetical protein
MIVSSAPGTASCAAAGPEPAIMRRCRALEGQELPAASGVIVGLEPGTACRFRITDPEHPRTRLRRA